MSEWGGRKVADARAQLVALYGWVCWLCNGPIPPDATFPHPLSFSVDHVIPRKRGGTHDLDNLRPSHLRCNTVKQARMPLAPDVPPPRRAQVRPRESGRGFFSH